MVNGELSTNGPFHYIFDICNQNTIDAADRVLLSNPPSFDFKKYCGKYYLWKEVQRISIHNLVLEGWVKLLNNKESTTTHSTIVPNMMTLHTTIDSLEYGTILIAIALNFNYSSPNAMLSRLDELAAEMVSSNNTGMTTYEMVNAAFRVMERHDIAGAFGEAYYHVKNSCISQVISNGGRGIPISLSMVLRSLLLRHGYHLELLNMPGHYVMKFRDHNQQSWIVDAYHKTLQTVEEFEAFFVQNGGQWSTAFLDPVTSCIPIWVRMLNNICVAVQRESGGNQHIGFLAMQQLLLIYQAEGSELAVKLHFQLLKTFVDFKAKTELVWTTNQQCIPLLPRLGARWTTALLAAWVASPGVTRPADLDPRVQLGTFVVGSPETGALLGVIVGWITNQSAEEEKRRVLVLYEGDGLEQRANEVELSYLEGPQEYPLRNIRIGRFFVEFRNGRYVPNQWLLSQFPG